MRAYPFAIVYLVPFSVILGYFIGGFFTFLTPFVVFIIVPLLDLVFGDVYENPDPNQEEQLKKRKSFRVLTWFSMPVSLGLVIWGAFIVSMRGLSFIEFLGFSISVGISSGVLGINASHEMQHRVNHNFEPILARLTLLSSLYIHWGLEHITGHHRWVATSEDPATARKNQSYYSFWPQTVFGSLKSAWRFEKSRLQRHNEPHIVWKNRVLHYLLYELVFLIGITFFFSFIGLFFFLLQSVVAISLLEVINYIEHYGLSRAKTADGRYERVKPHHSWNSSRRLTNWFLFNLQRHSDHHYKPGRRYQLLRHQEQAPQLPTGYAGMVLIALIPPLYKRIMNPLIPT
jgi:alkane 1-monooxygenase